jgi:hypothetical protein
MVSLMAWGLLSLVGLLWHPLRATSSVTILFAGAIGCFANWNKNRTFHCSISGWILLAGATAFLLTDTGVIRIEARFVWAFVVVGTLLSFILEWRYATRLGQ